MELYLLHPVAVHFPIALLTFGLGAAAVAALRGRPEWLHDAASRLLWVGTAAVWAALGLGLLAEDTVPHVPTAWRTMNEHKTLAFWTAGLFTALSAWRFFFGRRYEKAFLLGWVLAAGVLAATGWHGGELVFRHGVGFLKE